MYNFSQSVGFGCNKQIFILGKMLSPALQRCTTWAGSVIFQRGMAGHSKWAKIKRSKGAEDQARCAPIPAYPSSTRMEAWESRFRLYCSLCQPPCPTSGDLMHGMLTHMCLFRSQIFAKIARQLKMALASGGK